MVPILIPATVPDEDPIVPIVVVLLDHVPPTVMSASAIDEPEQTAEGPVMGEGTGLTEIIVVLKQPVGSA